MSTGKTQVFMYYLNLKNRLAGFREKKKKGDAHSDAIATLEKCTNRYSQ